MVKRASAGLQVHFSQVKQVQCWEMNTTKAIQTLGSQSELAKRIEQLTISNILAYFMLDETLQLFVLDQLLHAKVLSTGLVQYV